MLRTAMVLRLFAAGSLLAQASQWRQLTATMPTPLPGTTATYDHLRDRVVAFGGALNQYPTNHLREFDGTSWVTPTNGGPLRPAARAGAKLAFDGRRGEVVLVGGNVIGQFPLTSTWTWDGHAWTPRFPQYVLPPVAGGFTLTYDEDREIVLLYTGHTFYRWDGVDWAPYATNVTYPPSRTYHAAAWDSTRGHLLIHGGNASATQVRSDTWAWDGTSWSFVANGPAVTRATMVFDRERDRALLVEYGGSTWEFGGVSWASAPAAPGPGVVTFDRQRNRAVLAVEPSNPPTLPPGTTVVLEAPGLAIAQPYGVACGSPPLTASGAASARPVVGNTLGVELENVPGTSAFMCFGWSHEGVLGFTLPYPMDVWGLPGCWLLQSDDAITLPCTITGPGTARFDFALPNAAGLVGLRFFLQPWAPAPGLNPANAAIGNGVAVTVGSF